MVPPGASPFKIRDPLDTATLTPSQYNGEVSAAMEAMRMLMGELSPEEEKRFHRQWAQLFDFPTEESIRYFNKLNPLLSEFLSLRAAIATAAEEFDGAWEEAVIATSYDCEEGVREALAIAEKQKDLLMTLQARMSQIVKEIQSLGNPPDVQEAKKRARKKHEETVKNAKKIVKKEDKPTEKGSVPLATTQRAPLKREGEILIIPSSNAAVSATTMEVRAEVPPAMKAKTKKYRWHASGIGAVITEEPRAVLAFNYYSSSGDEAITVYAIDANGKEIGKGRVIMPAIPIFFQYDDGQGVKRKEVRSRISVNYDRSTQRSGPIEFYRHGYAEVSMAWITDYEKKSKVQVIHGHGFKDDTFRDHSSTRTKTTKVRRFSIGDFWGEIYEIKIENELSDMFGTEIFGEGYLRHPHVKSSDTVAITINYNFSVGSRYCWKDKEKDLKPECRALVEKEMDAMVGTINRILSSLRLVPEGVAVAEAKPEKKEEEKEDPRDKQERIAFHEANIRIIENNLAKDQEELSRETDPVRRAALEWRILQARSDIQAERDLIASIQTGEIVRSRTPFDDYVQAQMIENIKENQRRVEEYQRTLAFLNRLAGMLPQDEAEDARAFIKRQLPLASMAQMDKEKARKVASAIHEKVQGYYQGQSAKEEEKAAWANFGMEAAQNIKAGADATLFACSLVGGKGVMIAYQGVTGYIEGGPVEAVTRAAAWYSTPTYVAAEAFKGYQADGWKGAAGNAATAYLSGKAFEYGATQLGKQLGKKPISPAPGKVADTSGGMTASTLTAKEHLELAQFKQARLKGESLSKDFSRPQAELQALGRRGAPPQEIIKQQALVRKMAAEVNASPHAKNYLKYKGDALSQRGYNAHLKAIHAEVEAGFHETMKRKGWNKQELKEFRNPASAGSAGLDYDIGLVEQPTWITGKDGKL